MIVIYGIRDTFDISIGLDDVFEQPTDEVIIDRLLKRFINKGIVLLVLGLIGM